MQPKFTLRNYGHISLRIFAIALIIGLSAQSSFSQQAKEMTKQEMQQQLAASRLVSNDAGLPDPAMSGLLIKTTPSKPVSVQRTEAVCATYNGTLAAGDPTMSLRPFRDGANPSTTCPATSKVCNAADISAAGTLYDVYTFNNTQAAPQCVTITFTNNTAGFVNFVRVYQGTFNPAVPLCTNFLYDPGSSPAQGIPQIFTFTLPASTSCDIVVSSVGGSVNSSYTLVIDGICTPCVPINATQPVISSVPSNTCAGSPITLSIIGGSLNGAANWVWYTGGSCGGASIGSGTSLTVSPGATTTYSVRGEGGCAPAPGPCASQTVTVTPCTCLTPDVATICSGTIQRLSVTPPVAPVTFTTPTTGPITIPSSGTATPYPSVINVAALPTSGVYVQSVAINGFSHTWPGDVDIALRSPSGQTVILMSDIGDAAPNGVSGRNLVFADGAPAVPVPIANGTWKPTNSVGTFGVEPDNFPAPGPGPLNQPNPTLSMFSSSANPNGNWQLLVLDDTGGDAGSITSWSITFKIVPTASWTSNPAAPNTMFTDPNATTPYVLGTQADAIYVNPTVTTTYTATFAAGPCAPTQSVVVTVLPNPNITISPNGGCAPVTLTASGANPLTYVWSPSAGLNTTTGATVTAIPTSNQTYTVLGYGLNGCKNSASVNVGGISTSSVITAAVPEQLLLSESFDAAPLPSGWSENNLSNPLGTGAFSNWWQGTVGGVLLPPPFGSDYRGCAFLSGSGVSTISNWLISPVVTTQVGDKLTFWTNGAPPAFPDRLQVRWSNNGASTNVGATATSVGDFSNLWVDINPTYSSTGYPSTWTRFTVNITGVAPFVAGTGRLAFRYFVEGGGPSGANSNYIGVDSVRIARPLPGWCPNTVSTISVNITGGVPPYTLVYSNGSTQTIFPGYTSGTPIQVSPATTTTYTVVSVTGANGCPGIGNTGSATVVVIQPPSITAQPANTTVCVGATAVISAGVSPVVSTTTYQWQESTNGGASYSNITNGGIYSGATTSTLTLTGVTAGMNGYRYRIVVSGQCPPSPVTSAGAILTVNQPPTVTTNPVNRTVCTGSTATFTAAGTTAVGTVTYQWQVSTDGGITWNNISGATSASYSVVTTLSMTGYRYRCILTVAPCATTATTTVAILTVNPLPNVVISSADLAITPGQTTTISGTSSPAAVAWSWTLNGSVYPAPPNAPAATSSISVGIDALGTYQARATDANGCSNLSNTLVIGAEASDHLWIYPNPNNGNFQIRLYYDGAFAERRKVRIYNALGQLVAQKEFDMVTGSPSYLKMEFSLPRLAAGTYVAKVSSLHAGTIASGLFVIAE